MSNLALYIDTVARKLINSPTDAGSPALPDAYQGDALVLDLYFCTPTNDNARPYKVERYATATIAAKLASAIGNVYPTAGSFTLTFGANTTAAEGFGVTAANLQTALQGLGSIGAGNALVSGVDGSYYIVEFAGALANAAQSLITGVSVDLYPASAVKVTRLQGGGSGKNEMQLITLARTPIVSQSTFTEIAPGSTGAAVSIVQAGDGGTLHTVQKITWNAPPASGYFTLNFGVLGTTDPINFNASDNDIANAINAVLGTGKVTVSQKPNEWIEIYFTDFLNYAALTIDITSVQWFYGWTGTLTLTDFLLPADSNETRYLEIDLTPSGGAAKTVMQTALGLRRACGT